MSPNISILYYISTIIYQNGYNGIIRLNARMQVCAEQDTFSLKYGISYGKCENGNNAADIRSLLLDLCLSSDGAHVMYYNAYFAIFFRIIRMIAYYTYAYVCKGVNNLVPEQTGKRCTGGT